MLHIIEYKIPGREKWGEIHTFDSTLPGGINRIKGVMLNIIPDGSLKRHIESIKSVRTDEYYEEESENYYTRGEITYIAQENLVGLCNISLNNTSIVSCLSACVTKELEKSSFSQNLFSLSKPMPIKQGSAIRVVFEEKEKTPFATKEDVNELMDKIEREIKSQEYDYSEPIKDPDAFRQQGLAIYGLANKADLTKLTNGYTLKLYIDYD